MKKFLVCIYDKVACVYNLFGDFSNKGVILRTFTDLLKDPKFTCSSHSSDYDIVIVGEINVETGVVVPLNEKLINLSELVEKDVKNV